MFNAPSQILDRPGRAATTMRALVRQDGGIALVEVATPICRADDDVRIGVTTAGICRTDIYVAEGLIPVREPRIIGHEFAGRVLEAGKESDFEVGDTVTLIPLMECGDCASCEAGGACARPRFLGIEADGAFAEEIVVPAANVRRVPPQVDPRHAAYTEPVAAAMAVLNAPLDRDGRGVVIGDNRIAALTMRILAVKGFDRVEQVSAKDWQEHADRADFAIETEATPQAFDAMLRVLRPGGLAILKSRPAGPVPFDVALAVRKGLVMQAVNYASFDSAIDLIASGQLHLEDLLGPTYALEDFEAAFAASDGYGAVKSFFSISD